MCVFEYYLHLVNTVCIAISVTGKITTLFLSDKSNTEMAWFVVLNEQDIYSDSSKQWCVSVIKIR